MKGGEIGIKSFYKSLLLCGIFERAGSINVWLRFGDPGDAARLPSRLVPAIITEFSTENDS